MAEYEFSDEENRHIDSLRRKLQHIAILFLLLGALQLVQSFLLTDETARWISLAASILILGLGWLFIRPLDNLRRIITS
jgi:Mlc titration factor MtfA (ptsG expression regulator)